MSTARRLVRTCCAGLLLLVSVPVLLSAALGWHLFHDRSALPDLGAFERFELPVTGVVLDAHGVVLAELAREHRQTIPAGGIPPVLRAAILAGEDNRFLTHEGVDFRSLPRVLLYDLLHVLRSEALASEPFAQGGSTITQQVVRGWFLREMVQRERGSALVEPGRVGEALRVLLGGRAANKLLRKSEEVRLSLWLEQALLARLGSRAQVKEEILLRYVNLAYLGEGRYGFAEASQHYFARPLASLTSEDAPQAALLTARLRRPAETDPRVLLGRRNRVLARMAVNGFFSEQDALRHQQAPLSPLSPRAPKPPLPAVPGVLKGVFGELRQRGLGLTELSEGRVRVSTTIDARIQALAQEALCAGLAAYAQRHAAKSSPGPGAGERSARSGAPPQLQGAVIVLANGSAGVLAELGGRSCGGPAERVGRPTDFDRALDSQRQPGSLMKAFVYLAALRKGLALDAEVLDGPISVSMGHGQPVKQITNYDGRFLGAIPLRRALAQSRNAATVWLARRVGMGTVLETAHELGIESALARLPTTALGASEVTLLELANAYRAMASGVRATPHFLSEVVTRTTPGPSPLAGPAQTEPLGITKEQLAKIQEGLRGVVRLPGGTAHALDTPDFPVQVMGKTGTTSNFRDALFVGSTYGASGITVAVWLGFDDGTPLGPRESGAKAALPIFRNLVKQVYAEKLLGKAPRFPLAVEGGIDAFLARARARAQIQAHVEGEVDGKGEVQAADVAAEEGLAVAVAPRGLANDESLADH